MYLSHRYLRIGVFTPPQRISSFMKQKGFTLIELLVVISIIGLLSSVVMASLNTARIKARDALRRSEMTQLQLALETYYVDNGSYPLGPAGGVYNELGCGSTGNANWYAATAYTGLGGYIPNLAPQYIPVLPSDPMVSGSISRCFVYGSSNGTTYTLWDHNGYEGWTSGSGINDNMVRLLPSTSCTGTQDTFTVFGAGSTRCN